MIRGRSSTIAYLLEALLPYTDANLALTYRPQTFFKELESISCYKQRSLQNSYYRLIKQGLIFLEDGTPKLTAKGKARLQLYKPQKLKNASLMVIFDIPESDRIKRNQLRVLLRELRFKQVQKSVWVTNYECRDYLQAGIEDLELKHYVKIFESREL